MVYAELLLVVNIISIYAYLLCIYSIYRNSVLYEKYNAVCVLLLNRTIIVLSFVVREITAVILFEKHKASPEIDLTREGCYAVVCDLLHVTLQICRHADPFIVMSLIIVYAMGLTKSEMYSLLRLPFLLGTAVMIATIWRLIAAESTDFLCYRTLPYTLFDEFISDLYFVLRVLSLTFIVGAIFVRRVPTGMDKHITIAFLLEVLFSLLGEYLFIIWKQYGTKGAHTPLTYVILAKSIIVTGYFTLIFVSESFLSDETRSYVRFDAVDDNVEIFVVPLETGNEQEAVDVNGTGNANPVMPLEVDVVEEEH